MGLLALTPANLDLACRLYDNPSTCPSSIVCPYGREGECEVFGTVYVITCAECVEEYIRETGRPLWVRVEEHTDRLNKYEVTTPLAEHKLRKHDWGVGDDPSTRVRHRSAKDPGGVVDGVQELRNKKGGRVGGHHP